MLLRVVAPALSTTVRTNHAKRQSRERWWPEELLFESLSRRLNSNMYHQTRVRHDSGRVSNAFVTDCQVKKNSASFPSATVRWSYRLPSALMSRDGLPREVLVDRYASRCLGTRALVLARRLEACAFTVPLSEVLSYNDCINNSSLSPEQDFQQGITSTTGL